MRFLFRMQSLDSDVLITAAGGPGGATTVAASMAFDEQQVNALLLEVVRTLCSFLFLAYSPPDYRSKGVGWVTVSCKAWYKCKVWVPLPVLLKQSCWFPSALCVTDAGQWKLWIAIPTRVRAPTKTAFVLRSLHSSARTRSECLWRWKNSDIVQPWHHYLSSTSLQE